MRQTNPPGTDDPTVVGPGIVPPILEGDSFDNPIILSDGSTLSVTISSAQTYRYLKFVPSTSGIYTIESYNSTCDPAVWLYDEEYNQIGYGDNIGNDVNFRMHHILQQGETYYFVVDAPYQITGTYHVRFSAASSNALTSTATDTSYSVSISSPYQMKYYTFTPAVSTEYLFYSSNATGDPELTIYDEDFDLVTCNSTDMGLNYNFRITANLTAGETYYLAAHAYPGQTASYDFCILMVPTTINDVFMIRNQGSKQYMDIEGPVQQELVQQWSYHKDTQARWRIVKHDDGYYTIQSLYGNQYYVGIDSIAIGANIKLYSSISDQTRWKLYVKSSGEIFFEPKNAPGRVLSATNSTTGSNLTLKWMTASLNGMNIGKLESQSDTPLEGQRQAVWCWVPTARMVANHYRASDGGMIPYNRQQQNAVAYVTNISWVEDQIQYDGNIFQTLAAICYYRTSYADINQNPTLNTYTDSRYSQYILRQFLNDGHVVWIGRTRYNPDYTDVEARHAYVIVGYRAKFENGTIRYEYIVYNPWPNPEPNSWNSDVPTEGQTHYWTYEQICDGKDGSADNDNVQGIWDLIIAPSTPYSDNTTDSDNTIALDN